MAAILACRAGSGIQTSPASQRRLALLIAAPHGGETAMQADVRACREVLLRRGLRESEIVQVEAGADRNATLAALAELDRAISVWPDGTVFLYFSGHGTFHGETLATAEPAILFEKDELPWTEVLDSLARRPKVQVTLLADC